MGASFL